MSPFLLILRIWWRARIPANIKNCWKNVCRPYGIYVIAVRRYAARINFPLDLGLTPRANFIAAAGAASLIGIRAVCSTARHSENCFCGGYSERVRTVPSLRDSATCFHSTQDSASLRPGLTALPPLRGSFFVSHTPPPKIRLSSHADSTALILYCARSARLKVVP